MKLYEDLTARNISAFYDVISIHAGRYGPTILNQIACRPYFLLVLTPGTLERCKEPGDWLQREIEHAVHMQRQIVPVHTRSFDAGDIKRFLPPELADSVCAFQWLELSQKYFKYAVQELAEEFLAPIQVTEVSVSAEEQAEVDKMLRAAQTAPKVTAAQLSDQELFERALARANRGDAEGAIDDFDEGIRLNPDFAGGFRSRGDARLSDGDLKGAIADFREAIRLDPEDAGAFYGRGVARSRPRSLR